MANLSTAKRVQKRALSSEEELLPRFYGFPEPQAKGGTSLGSGVMVSTDGFIVTKSPVILGADEIAVVMTDEMAARARLVGADPKAALAVLTVTRSELSAMTFADSDQIRVGDSGLALGNPFGVGQTVTSGIVIVNTAIFFPDRKFGRYRFCAVDAPRTKHHGGTHQDRARGTWLAGRGARRFRVRPRFRSGASAEAGVMIEGIVPQCATDRGGPRQPALPTAR